MRGCTCWGLTLCPQCERLARMAGVASTITMPPVVSEKAFQAAVVRLAREHGWLCYHTHDSRKSLPGFPDLVCAHPSGQRPLLFAELKIPGGSLTLQQQAWLEALTRAEGTEVAVWMPEQWEQIQWRLTQ